MSYLVKEVLDTYDGDTPSLWPFGLCQTVGAGRQRLAQAADLPLRGTRRATVPKC